MSIDVESDDRQLGNFGTVNKVLYGGRDRLQTKYVIGRAKITLSKQKCKLLTTLRIESISVTSTTTRAETSVPGIRVPVR